MPRCSACEVRKEAMAQQASVIEALTRALDAVRPAVALSYGAETKGQVWTATLPQESVTHGELPTDVRKAMVTVAGFDGPLRDHLEDWATTALSFGMTEAEVARRIFEGETE
jgi:hypothetical protein